MRPQDFLGLDIPEGANTPGERMSERVKDFIARHVFHPLQGMTLGDWWSLLRRHRFAIDLRHWPRALVQTAASASNSVGRPGSSVRASDGGSRPHESRPPCLSSGTTAAGPRTCTTCWPSTRSSPPRTFFQALNPHTFLSTERWAAPVVDRLILRRRYQDEMALGTGMPSEDEFATCTMTGLSPYMAWCFPGDGAGYDRYLTFLGCPGEGRSCAGSTP